MDPMKAKKLINDKKIVLVNIDEKYLCFNVWNLKA